MFRGILKDVDDLQFNLIYHGALPSHQGDSTRAKDKQRIRQFFRPQLKTLWETHPNLSRVDPDDFAEGRFARRMIRPLDDEWDERRPRKDVPSHILWCQLGGYRFQPLVSRYLGLSATVGIDFFRQGMAGDLVSGGDIDNRIKVLLDALRMPHDVGELCGDEPVTPNELFYTVLEDDSLITSISVEANQLLAPILPSAKITDVWLRIRIRIEVMEASLAGLAFL